MAILENIIDVSGISAGVYGITKNSTDAAAAAGYAQWIKAVTGKLPYLEKDEYGRARLFLDPQQAETMRKWLQAQAIKSLRSTPRAGTLYIDFRPVAEPLTLTYGLFAGFAFAALGFFLGRTF